MNGQGELDFDSDGTESGYTNWLAGRKVAAEELAQRLGVPLGHSVEIWLFGGVRLRGTLRLQEETLLIEEEHVRHLGLEVDHVAFTIREIESCVRLD